MFYHNGLYLKSNFEFFESVYRKIKLSLGFLNDEVRVENEALFLFSWLYMVAIEHLEAFINRVDENNNKYITIIPDKIRNPYIEMDEQLFHLYVVENYKRTMYYFLDDYKTNYDRFIVHLIYCEKLDFENPTDQVLRNYYRVMNDESIGKISIADLIREWMRAYNCKAYEKDWINEQSTGRGKQHKSISSPKSDSYNNNLGISELFEILYSRWSAYCMFALAQDRLRYQYSFSPETTLKYQAFKDVVMEYVDDIVKDPMKAILRTHKTEVYWQENPLGVFKKLDEECENMPVGLLKKRQFTLPHGKKVNFVQQNYGMYINVKEGLYYKKKQEYFEFYNDDNAVELILDFWLEKKNLMWLDLIFIEKVHGIKFSYDEIRLRAGLNFPNRDANSRAQNILKRMNYEYITFLGSYYERKKNNSYRKHPNYSAFIAIDI